MKKLLSIFTLCCFLISVIGTDIARAVSPAVPANAENAVGLIPSKLGRVVGSESFDKRAYTIINIQDLHCDSEVQKNISLIIDALQKSNEISCIFVEGGYGKVDTEVFNKIKDERFRDAVIEGMLRDGRLTGAEYYSIKNSSVKDGSVKDSSVKDGSVKDGSKIPIYGLEDETVHKQNLERLARALDSEPRYEQELAKIKNEIGYLQFKYFSRNNKRFDKIVKEYRSGSMKPDKYYAL
ncbi:MAG: hypothetical protein FWC57_04450, partial [Endomicrobia bacterium]|nr:hypothetical protein [Endomicrobiia bacterium]